MFEVGAPDGWAVSGDADVGEGEGAAENGCVVPGWVVAGCWVVGAAEGVAVAGESDVGASEGEAVTGELEGYLVGFRVGVAVELVGFEVGVTVAGLLVTGERVGVNVAGAIV